MKRSKVTGPRAAISAAMTPVEFPKYTAPALHAPTKEDSYSNINSSNHQHVVNQVVHVHVLLQLFVLGVIGQAGVG